MSDISSIPASNSSNPRKGFKNPNQSQIVYGKTLEDLVDTLTDGSSTDFNVATATVGALTTTGLNTLTGGKVISTNVTEYTVETTLTATEIVGTAAGDLGHAAGAILVAAPGSGLALQFVNAVLIYDYDTAAYTDGAGDDLTINVADVPVSGAIATADLITKAGDTVISLNALTNDYVLGVNSTINLQSTAVTNPGTAAGVIRAIVTYRVITTNL